MNPVISPEVPYHSLNSYLKLHYGERVQKITLDAGLTCPNRDGRVGRGGCIYCNSRGSGTGAKARGHSLTQQLTEGIAKVGKRYQAKKFIAYFQSFSNTYGSLETLRRLYDEALAHPQVVGLSIGTRPDCLSPELINLLSSYCRTHSIWLELGLQSSHDRTLQVLNRGHDVSSFVEAVHMSVGTGLHVLTHVILGLPQETRSDMLATAHFLGTLPVQGVKIHLLYVIKNTPLAALYAEGRYEPLIQEEYVNLVVEFIELLPPNLIIHRLTGDPHLDELVAPHWCLDKSAVMQDILKTFGQRQTYQGRLWKATNRDIPIPEKEN
jgi:radical SAM protein (TIGR01212 family)